ncbi:MAG: hypothetical protein ACT4NY_29995 [Pseudonocardiales bacterium]
MAGLATGVQGQRRQSCRSMGGMSDHSRVEHDRQRIMYWDRSVHVFPVHGLYLRCGQAGLGRTLRPNRPKLAHCLQVSVEQLEELLTEGDEKKSASDERLLYALQHPGSVDLVIVARLREQVHTLDERYARAPSTSLLAETGQCLGQVVFLRAHAPTTRVCRELQVVEAESATLMGQLVWDASQRRDQATAHGYFDQAIETTRQLQDPAAEGLALLRKGFVALYGEKDPLAGLSLTMQTAETTRSTSPAWSQPVSAPTGYNLVGMTDAEVVGAWSGIAPPRA